MLKKVLCTTNLVALIANLHVASSSSPEPLLVIGERLPYDVNGPVVKNIVSTRDAVYPLRCTDAPEQEIVECPRADMAKASLNLGPATKVIFNNTNSEKVFLYWLNENAVEELKDVVEPGARVAQETKMGHMFRFRNQYGRILLDHVVGLRPLYNDAGIQDPPPDPVQNESRPAYEKENHGFVKGYMNRAGFHLTIKWLNPRTNHLQMATQMKADEFNFEHTYPHHEFHAFTADNRFVTKFAVDDVAIPVCPDVAPIEDAFDMLGEQANVVDNVDVCGTNSTVCNVLEGSDGILTIPLEATLKIGMVSMSM